MPQAIRPAFISCARCGAQKQVGKRGPIPVYCSDACRSGKRHAQRIDIICAHCEQPAAVRRGAVYCSPRCRNAHANSQARQDGRYDKQLRARRQATAEGRLAKTKPCPYCAAPMVPPKIKHCGTADCKRAFNAERMRQWQRSYKTEHGQWYPQARFAEQQREYNKLRYQEKPHWRKQYPDRAMAADARRRALVQQARTVEVFTPLEVHTRDDWTCQLCRLPIDPSIAWPDPMSPSIDHVIPLSRGGAHSIANVQSAHLGCNSSKGDKLLTETTDQPLDADQ